VVIITINNLGTSALRDHAGKFDYAVVDEASVANFVNMGVIHANIPVDKIIIYGDNKQHRPTPKIPSQES
jgi:hypothetical protein